MSERDLHCCRDIPIFLDASAVVHISETGCGADVLLALSDNHCNVVAEVVNELRIGAMEKGHLTYSFLLRYRREGLVVFTRRDESLNPCVEDWIQGTGDVPRSLGRGESGTMVEAMASGGIAILDDHTAIKACRNKYPDLTIRRTLDLVSHTIVRRELGEAKLAEAIRKAFPTYR